MWHCILFVFGDERTISFVGGSILYSERSLLELPLCPHHSHHSHHSQKTLEREVRGCQHLVLWTDGDREGEGIAAEIVEVVTNGMLLNFCVCACVCVCMCVLTVCSLHSQI